MNLYHFITGIIQKCAHTVGVDLPPLSVSLPPITVEPAKDPKHGDIATNAALIWAKVFQKKPVDVAAWLADSLNQYDFIEQVDVAGPGFINITLTTSFWQDQLAALLAAGHDFGKGVDVSIDPVLVEYVSVNPTGPLHAGHGRNAILGDTLASLLAFYGHNVTREYYINDAGGQIEALAQSVMLRYRQLLGHQVSDNDFTADMYKGDYITAIAQNLITEDLVKRDGRRYEEAAQIKDIVVAMMMKTIKQDLAYAGVVMDSYVSEKALHEQGTLDAMKQALGDYLYTGTLPPPKGMPLDHDTTPENLAEPQLLFKATAFGDDVDRVIQKADGGWTYFAGDAAYHFHKYQRGFTQMINVFGADHVGYVKRLVSVVDALTHKKVQLQVKVTQMVNFMDNGTAVRMSKRSGTFITLRDVIDAVGVDATRFMMVSRHQDTPLDFDFARVKEHTKENPIFYIHYAHARIQSVKRHIYQEFPDLKDPKDTALSYLVHQSEIDMIKLLATWPRTVAMAVQFGEPHRLANGVCAVAAAFHSLWNQGDIRFLVPEDKSLTQARLALLIAIETVIQIGLKILGITPVDELRFDAPTAHLITDK